jgi:hypothetical protein
MRAGDHQRPVFRPAESDRPPADGFIERFIDDEQLGADQGGYRWSLPEHQRPHADPVMNPGGRFPVAAAVPGQRHLRRHLEL